MAYVEGGSTEHFLVHPSPSLSPSNSQHPPVNLRLAGETKAVVVMCCNAEHKQLLSVR